jgi:hypothetical protein
MDAKALRGADKALRFSEHREGDGEAISATHMRLWLESISQSDGTPLQVRPQSHLAEDQEPGLRAAMTGGRRTSLGATSAPTTYGILRAMTANAWWGSQDEGSQVQI